MIKCIIFDSYSTLISTGTGSVDAVRKILADKSIDSSPEEFYAMWKKLHKQNMQTEEFLNERNIFELDLKMLYELYGINADYKADVIHMINSLYDRAAFSDTKAAIEKLSVNYDIVIGSNTDTEPLIQNLNYNELRIDKIFTSQTLKCYKPNRSFYEKILESTGYKADEVLFVGDSLKEDVVVPQELGMATCFVNRAGITNDTEIAPDYTVETLTQLAEMM